MPLYKDILQAKSKCKKMNHYIYYFVSVHELLKDFLVIPKQTPIEFVSKYLFLKIVSELTIWLLLNACFSALLDSGLQSSSCYKIKAPQPEFGIAFNMSINLKCKYVDVHWNLRSCLNIC